MTASTPEQMRALADDVQHTVDNGYEFAPENVVDALRTAADQLEAVRTQVTNYAGWYEYSPEDSWRFERDLRTAIGMPQYRRDGL